MDYTRPTCQASRAGSDKELINSGIFDDLRKLLKWLGTLAGQRTSWSPILIGGELWRLLTNLGTQREIFGLLKFRPYAEIVETRPRLAFKYLMPDYLARGLGVLERASCFLCHYRRTRSVLPESTLRQILLGEATLFEIFEGASHFAITIGMQESAFDREGELSLHLRVDNEDVFDLTFTIGPGWVAKSGSHEIILVTRIQGKKGRNRQIKLARRAFGDYSPRTILLAALQGIACAFDIGTIAAVGATKQRSYTSKSSSTIKRGYDDFFTKLGMSKTAAGFYSCSIPIKGKPLSLFKGRAKSQAKKRRAMRQQIQFACAAFFKGTANRAAESFCLPADSAILDQLPQSGAVTFSCSEPGHDPILRLQEQFFEVKNRSRNEEHSSFAPECEAQYEN